MIERLYRFGKGVLVIDLRGKNVFRLVNLCIKKGIPLWNMKSEERMQCSCEICLNDLYELRPLLRKTKVRLFIKKRIGVPFLLHRYRKRKVFVTAIAVMVVFVAFLSTRIWRIEVVGNSSIGDETILAYLAEKDIGYGVSRNSIDNDELELSLRQDFSPVIWASVYEEGTKLVVCIQEKIASEKPPVSGDACMDLVASEDAVIASVITRSGLANIKAGDVVKKGDLLVCGRQEILDDGGEVKEYFYQNADADVMGYVILDYEDWIPEQTIVSKNTGNERKRYFLRVFDYQFTMPQFYTDYDCFEAFEEVHQLCLMKSFYLPVYVGSIREVEQEKHTQFINKNEAKELALLNLDQFLADLEENGVLIMDKNVMIERKDKKYHVYGEIKVCKDITECTPTEILANPMPKETEEE